MIQMNYQNCKKKKNLYFNVFYFKRLKETDNNFLRNSNLMSENEIPKVTKEISNDTSMINIFGILLSKKFVFTTKKKKKLIFFII